MQKGNCLLIFPLIVIESTEVWDVPSGFPGVIFIYIGWKCQMCLANRKIEVQRQSLLIGLVFHLGELYNAFHELSSILENIAMPCMLQLSLEYSVSTWEACVCDLSILAPVLKLVARSHCKGKDAFPHSSETINIKWKRILASRGEHSSMPLHPILHYLTTSMKSF